MRKEYPLQINHMNNVPVRFYDKLKKTMLYPEHAIENGIFLSAHGEPVQMQNGVFQRLGHIVVMHRTPHMDDSKQFIWEADVCDMLVPNEYGSVQPARGVMIMDTTLQKWNLEIVYPKTPLTAGLHVPSEVGRVGNIYENPKLLTGTPVHNEGKNQDNN